MTNWIEQELVDESAEVKSLVTKTTRKVYDLPPSPDEGEDGEIRVVYVKGIPAIFAKANGAWHFHQMKTMGTRGIYKADEGAFDASILNDFMPKEPSADSGWRYLLPTMDIAAGTMYGPSGGSNDAPAGAYFENVPEGVPQFDNIGNTFYDETPVYLWNHGLNLARPPRMIQAYTSNAAPSAQWATEQIGDSNVNVLVSPPDMSDYQAIVNEAMSGLDDVMGNLGSGTFSGRYEEELDSRVVLPVQVHGGPASPFSGFNILSCTIQLVTPNHLSILPTWNVWYYNPDGGTSQDADEGSTQALNYVNQFMEWFRIYIWK